MTIEEAIEILNQVKHNDAEGWHITGSLDLYWVSSEWAEYRMTFFEAIAVAEKHKREG